MSISYFLHVHGDAAQASALLQSAETEFQKIDAALENRGSVVMHTSVAVPGSDPLPVDQDARLLLCQVHVEADAISAATLLREAFAAAGNGLGKLAGGTVLHHVMAAERIKPGAP